MAPTRLRSYLQVNSQLTFFGLDQKWWVQTAAQAIETWALDAIRRPSSCRYDLAVKAAALRYVHVLESCGSFFVFRLRNRLDQRAPSTTLTARLKAPSLCRRVLPYALAPKGVCDGQRFDSLGSPPAR